MTRIELAPDEDISSALRRFGRKIAYEYGVRWYKKRLGFHEKSSTLARKRKKMKAVVTQAKQRALKLGVSPRSVVSFQLSISQRERYARTGPNNAMGR
jgi:ribosomal protein S21